MPEMSSTCFPILRLAVAFLLLVAVDMSAASDSQKLTPLTVTPVREADASCAACHQNIYCRYLNTSMANASGLATEHAIPGSFLHTTSKMAYRVSLDDQRLWLSYGRTGDLDSEGRQRLEYFLGSGHLGVTYMYSIRGFLLESPIAYYSSFKGYDMKPGLSDSLTMPAALPISSECMRCHMSGVQREDQGTINHYGGLPFQYGGITCESCHGDTREHVASRGRAPVMNPIRLDAERRDSVCIRCHLEGDTNVEHRGRSLADYKPGDRIEDYLSYFVYADANMSSRGVSEVEELGVSKCKRVSGDRMSCMSCHDSHDSPAADERAGFYRIKCLKCHTQAKYATEHYPSNPDCTHCHMPSGKAENIPHVAWTDHRIRQHPDQPEVLPPTPATTKELIPLLRQDVSARDLALAYFNLVADGKLSEEGRALQELLSVQKSDPDDPAVLAALGYLAESMGTRAEAIEYYRAALRLNPFNLSATNDLATLLAKSGDLMTAVTLWEKVFDLNEDIEPLGINLAIADCRLGDRKKSQQILQRVLIYSPNSPIAKQRLRSMEAGTEMCSAN
jgi:tetratricopeptide (TPR) repeat protein